MKERSEDVRSRPRLKARWLMAPFLISIAVMIILSSCAKAESGALTVVGESTVDVDADGKFEFLVLHLNFDAPFSDTYWVSAYVTDESGNFVYQPMVEVYLDAGMNSLDLKVPGAAIATVALDGPYVVEATAYAWSYAVIETANYLTGDYSKDDFEAHAALVTPFEELVFDENGVPGYDALAVIVGVDALAEGDYDVEGYLTDASDTMICTAANSSIHLVVGMNEVGLRFSASAIAGHGVDGPYTVGVLLNWEDRITLDMESQVTDPYLSVDFEKSCVILGPLNERTEDVDADGYIDYLELGAYADVRTSGTYYFEFVLRNRTGGLMEDIWTYNYYEPGTWYVYTTYYCAFVIPYGEEGPFTLDIIASEGWWTPPIDDMTFETTAYALGTFEGAGFVEPLSESAEDDNGNGMRDGVLVEFELFTTTEGLFCITGLLADPFGYVLTSSSTYVYAMVGSNPSSLMFAGQGIFESGIDGPYDVQLTLLMYDGWSFTEVDVAELQTAAYLASEFDHASFLPPCTETTTDHDSDGLVEYINIEVGFNAPAPGTYLVEGVLTQGAGNYIGHWWELLELSGGAATTTMRFATPWIMFNGADGPYELALRLSSYDPYSGSTILLAEGTHTTEAYAITAMEPPAIFGEYFGEGVIDEDGAGYWDYLVVYVPIEVTCPGTYHVSSDLTDPFGTSIVSSGWDGYLDVGITEVQQWYTGFFIYEYGYDGQFVVELQLTDDFGNFVDHYEYTTGTYAHEEFDHIAFTGAWSESLVDDDGNGFYNALVIVLEVSSTAWQDIVLEGYLIHPSFAILGHGMIFPSVTPGLSYIEFRFDLASAAKLQLDGPYYALFFLSSNIGQDSIDFETSAWTSDRFDHIYFASTPRDHGLDQDMDGWFEYVELEIDVDSTMDRMCLLRVDFYDHYGNYLTSTVKNTLIHVGINTVIVRVVGLTMMSYANGETFVIYYSMFVDDHFVEQIIAETSNAYDPMEFESIGWFVSDPTFILTNYDEDGLYEDLKIEAAVHVEFAKWYVVSGSLWDMYGGSSFTRMELFLMPGDHVVELRFSGMDIVFRVQDAPWDVQVILFDIEDNILATSGVRVEECLISQFEPVASLAAIEEKGLDSDMDGLFEYLEVEVLVNVLGDGEYVLEVMLSDSDWVQICRSYSWAHLVPGLQNVRILLCGGDISNWPMDGPFMLDVRLSDVTTYGISVLDYWSLSTAGYLASEFEDGAYLGARWEQTSHGVDTDGDGLFEWLEVDVQVFVATKGLYTLRAILYEDDWLLDISSVEVKVHLKAGWQTIKLRFSGVDIWAKGLNGPFGAEIWLMDKSGRVLDEGDAVTSHYLPEQFEGIKVEPSPKKDTIQISLKSKGELVVKVFGNEMLDVSKIDPASIRMGLGIKWISLTSWKFEDCNKDGFLDLVIRFSMADVRNVVSLGMTSIGFQMVYDGVLVEVQSPIAVKK